MIRFVDTSLLPLLRQRLTDRNLYACRIGCWLDSYGLSYPFAEFYVQVNAQGHCTGAAARYYQDITLLLTDESDTDEWRSWLNLIGFRSLLCDRPLLPTLPAEDGTVMTLTQPVLSVPVPPKGFTPTNQPELKALWTLLKRCEAEDFAVPAYEDFLPDFSHKLRHGTASCCVLFSHNQSCAAALTVAQTARTAVIGGVCTDPHHRRQGLGTWCVQTLCHVLADRTVFLMRDPCRHSHFYHQCGFDNTARFYMYRT